MLKLLGIVLMVLAALAALLSFQDGPDPVLLGSALSAFVGGAVVLGLGSIQDDVRALRDHLVPALELSATPSPERSSAHDDTPSPDDPAELNELRGHLKRGAISHAEFEREKRRLLSS